MTLASVTPLVRAAFVFPSAPTSAYGANGSVPFAALTMSSALMPSTSSAFRPVATPVALVVNGLASRAVLPVGGLTSITPPRRLLSEVKRKLPPPPVFFESRQYSFAAVDRQPYRAAPPSPSRRFDCWVAYVLLLPSTRVILVNVVRAPARTGSPSEATANGATSSARISEDRTRYLPCPGGMRNRIMPVGTRRSVEVAEWARSPNCGREKDPQESGTAGLRARARRAYLVRYDLSKGVLLNRHTRGVWIGVLAAVAACTLATPLGSKAAVVPTLSYACDPPSPAAPQNCAIWHTSPVTVHWIFDSSLLTAVPGTACASGNDVVVAGDTPGTDVTCSGARVPSLL